jgi:dTDP-4-amino-4,6-dideoxygalactose transaminase
VIRSKREGKKTRIPFGTVSITPKSKRLIKEILDSGRVSCGKYVREFEKRFAELIGTKEAVALSSGTDADALALAVLYDFGAKRDDEVIVPALSFVATGNAVLQAGFKPVFVDVEKETLNIDPSKIEAAITKRTKAIMPVHLVGKPADMDAINKIAKRHGIFVIEDAAEAYGAEYKGRNVGTLGDMAAFSLYVAHIITTVEGGIIVTNKKEFAEILRSLRSHGRACKCGSCVLNINSGYCKKRFQYGEKNDIRFVFERVGYSSKMNELEAAIGLGNLDKYQEILGKRRQNLGYLMRKFKEFGPYMVTIEEGAEERIGPHAFPVIVQEGAPFSREEITDYLEKSGIDTRTLFSSMPTQCPGFKFLGHRLGDFPNAEYIGNNGFHIGIHQDLGKRHLDYFLDRMGRFLKGRTK